jgi:hypothetical protein
VPICRLQPLTASGTQLLFIQLLLKDGERDIATLLAHSHRSSYDYKRSGAALYYIILRLEPPVSDERPDVGEE